MVSRDLCIFFCLDSRLSLYVREPLIFYLAQGCATRNDAFLPSTARNLGFGDAGLTRRVSYTDSFFLVVSFGCGYRVMSIEFQRFSKSYP